MKFYFSINVGSRNKIWQFRAFKMKILVPAFRFFFFILFVGRRPKTTHSLETRVKGEKLPSCEILHLLINISSFEFFYANSQRKSFSSAVEIEVKTPFNALHPLFHRFISERDEEKNLNFHFVFSFPPLVESEENLILSSRFPFNNDIVTSHTLRSSSSAQLLARRLTM
jgi:hypothetical protein